MQLTQIPGSTIRPPKQRCWERNTYVIDLIRQYLAVLRKGTHQPGAEAELERIYMDVLRKDPDHRLISLHELMIDGVSFNIAEQVRDLLAEEITALDPIAHDNSE